jgi:hypothetical protein
VAGSFTWYQAFDTCKARGARLPEINSAQEHADISNIQVCTLFNTIIKSAFTCASMEHICVMAKCVNQIDFPFRRIFGLGQLTMPKKEATYGNHQRPLSPIPIGRMVNLITGMELRTACLCGLVLLAVGMTYLALTITRFSVKSYSLVRKMVWACLL